MKLINDVRAAGLIFAGVGLFAFAGNALCDNWPQWRGPKRDGQSAERGLLQEWPKSGPKELWQARKIGSGFSTPAVVGDRMYLLSNEGLEHEYLIALATKDGSRIWSVALGSVGNPQQQPNYPAARSTPTVDGKLVYALGSDGDLVCAEAANGKEKWRKSLRTDFKGDDGEWAYAESPLVDGDKVVCTPGGGNATIVALNKLTGAVVWKAGFTTNEASYACLIPFEAGGIKQYVQFLPDGLASVEAATGKLLWRYEKSAKGSPAVILTPLAADGCIYTGAFRGGCSLVRPTLKSGAFDVEELYFDRKLPVGLGGVVKVGDYFYGSSGDSVMCVEFKTGKVRWNERGVGPSSWAVADGRLYLHAEKGDVVLLEPTPEGYREKGHFQPENRPDQGQAKAWAYPVISNGKLYIREGSALWCYDLKSS